MKIQRLTQYYIFKDFDCGNEDLNDFLFNDSKRYLKSRLAVTYIIESEDRDRARFHNCSVIL